jgi:hypothetical protein
MQSIAQAASLLGRRSAEARAKAWGTREFVRRMREWGKLGGRPQKSKLAAEKENIRGKRH